MDINRFSEFKDENFILMNQISELKSAHQLLLIKNDDLQKNYDEVTDKAEKLTAKVSRLSHESKEEQNRVLTEQFETQKDYI